jgi:hypothetical protein
MIKIVNLKTGEVIERELNAEELAQRKIDTAADLASRQFIEAQAEAKAKAKAAAQSKLAALGLTVEDLQALGL